MKTLTIDNKVADGDIEFIYDNASFSNIIIKNIVDGEEIGKVTLDKNALNKLLAQEGATIYYP